MRGHVDADGTLGQGCGAVRDPHHEPNHNETPRNPHMRHLQFKEKDLHSPKTSMSKRQKAEELIQRLKETGDVTMTFRAGSWPGSPTKGGKVPRLINLECRPQVGLEHRVTPADHVPILC